ncbi:RhoGEF domain-containing protein [Tieghemostelium lacteum]|uniref:RhoGEF domain-containing protein n=1 Tax=Tieghemostelium lacteum TaxID=361077 RepID=A0A151ZHR4_TIELA|nr:RhoGEF domain-containing protein [Tieghemostelium lacteum]|eukprot:KYQ93455.1 RhoGEF domain-containing protein [Tieghemostelium lacteum]
MKDPNEIEREKAALIIQCCYRGWVVRRAHKDFFRKIHYRKFIIKEIISFEKQYMEKINSILVNVKQPLITDIDRYKKFLTVEKVNLIFSNLDEILGLHQDIFEVLTTSNTAISIGRIYLEMLPKFKIYLDYVKNYNLAFKIYAKLENYIDFSSFMEGLYLPSYLISPIQHTPRYVLLFADLTKNTNPQNEDYTRLQQLVDVARKTASEINQSITASPPDQSEEEESEEEIEEVEVPQAQVGKGKHSTVKHLSPNTSQNSGNSPFKRPASASSKRKPRNSIIMHKNAIDKVLSDSENHLSTPYTSQDFSHLPSYLRPTQASLAWSKNKVELPSIPKMRISTNSQDKIDNPYVYSHLPPSKAPPSELFIDRSTPKNKPEWKSATKTPTTDYTKITKKIIRPTSPLPKPNFYSPTLTSTKTNSSPTLLDFSSSLPTSSKPPIFNNNNNNNNSNSNNNNSNFKLSSSKKSLSSNSLLSSSSSDGNNSEPKSTSVSVTVSST